MKQAFAAKQTWIDRCFDNPAAIAALVVFMTSSATLVGAWYFENVLKILPCPLCLEQRIPYRLVIPLSLLIVITALLRAPWKLLAAGFIVIIVADLWGAVIGVYHAGLEWHLWAGPTDCSGSLSGLSARMVRCSNSCIRLTSYAATKPRGASSASRLPAITS